MKISFAVIILFVFIAIGGLVMSACEPGPEQYAKAAAINVATEATATAAAIDASFRATSVASSAQATATSAAVSSQATADVNKGMATATAAAWAQQIAATETAVPNQDFKNDVSNANSTARQWIVSIVVVGGGTLAFFAGLIALVAMLQTRAKLIPRGRDGQLPGVLIGNTVMDPSHQIGPAATMPQGPGLLWNLARAVRYVRTGEVLPPPEQCVQLTDGGAGPDHLLEMAKTATISSAQANATIGMFDNPKVGNADRRERIEVLQTAAKSVAGMPVAPATTRIMLPAGDVGQAWLRAVANAFQVEPKQLTDGVVDGDFEKVDGGNADGADEAG